MDKGHLNHNFENSYNDKPRSVCLNLAIYEVFSAKSRTSSKYHDSAVKILTVLDK